MEINKKNKKTVSVKKNFHICIFRKLLVFVQTFDEAVTACPQSARLTYMSALYQLTSDSSDVEAALIYLEKHVSSLLDLQGIIIMLMCNICTISNNNKQMYSTVKNYGIFCVFRQKNKYHNCNSTSIYN